jgi:sugar O-acyltransferase (sialic acid O-acetyltransferase NeuD family)
MSASPLYIYGGGGLGSEIKVMLGSTPEWKVEGFYDDGKKKGSTMMGVPCLGGLAELLNDSEPRKLIIAIADPQLKKQIARKLSHKNNISFPVIIDPRATLLDKSTITIAAGSIITAGCILTTNITIGEHVLLNLNTTIGHNTVIGSHCSIMPGVNIAGEIILEDEVLIGSGANLINHITIGTASRVGSGAVVTRSVLPGKTVVGVPAREANAV